MLSVQLTIFILATTGIAWLSRRSLLDPRSHGFYRFFAWEIILILFLLNVKYWFVDPFSLTQIIAWTLLVISLVPIIWGVRLFRQHGKIDAGRTGDPTLIGIEKTTRLVTTGLYKYIRHPFYSSLLFLAWGVFFKQPGWLASGLTAAVTLLLVLTARREEIENIAYFGQQYQEYMQHTKMFIPIIF